MDSLPEWLENNSFYHDPSIDKRKDNSDEKHTVPADRKQVLDPENANLIGSQWSSHPHELHKIFLDIDVPHVYKSSRTPGHGHLILNINVTRSELVILNELFVALGITGKGNAQQVEKEGQNFLRINIEQSPTKEDDPWWVPTKSEEPF